MLVKFQFSKNFVKSSQITFLTIHLIGSIIFIYIFHGPQLHLILFYFFSIKITKMSPKETHWSRSSLIPSQYMKWLDFMVKLPLIFICFKSNQDWIEPNYTHLSLTVMKFIKLRACTLNYEDWPFVLCPYSMKFYADGSIEYQTIFLNTKGNFIKTWAWSLWIMSLFDKSFEIF